MQDRVRTGGIVTERKKEETGEAEGNIDRQRQRGILRVKERTKQIDRETDKENSK